VPKTITSVRVYRASTYTVAVGDEVQVGGSNELYGLFSRAIVIERPLGEADKLTTTIIRGSGWTLGDKISMRTRLVVTYSDDSAEMFRVREVTPDATGMKDMNVEAWSMWTDLAAIFLRYVRTPSPFISYEYPLRDRTVEDLLTDVVFNTEFGVPSFFELGSISTEIASVKVSIDSKVASIQEVLYAIADQVLVASNLSLELEDAYNPGTNKLVCNFVREAGAVAAEKDPYNPDPSSRPVRGPGKSGQIANRSDLTYTDAQDDFYSRLVPFAGGEDARVGVGGVWWNIVSYTEGTKTFVLETGAVPYDDAYVDDVATGATFFVEVDNLALTMSSDTDAQVTTTDEGSVSVTVATHKAAYLTAAKLRFYTTIGGGVAGAVVPGSFVTYIHNPVAEQAKGVVESIVDYEEIVPFDNEFFEADGSADMSTWGAPAGGTVKGVDSLPEGLLVYAPDTAYQPEIRGATVSTKILIVTGDFSAVPSGDTFTMVAGSSWTGQYTLDGSPTYDAVLGETEITVTALNGGEADIDYLFEGTGFFLAWDEDYILVEESMDPDYVLNGTLSAKVTASLIGVGLRTENITIERTAENAYLSAWASASVLQGSVKLQVVDVVTGDVYPPVESSDQAQWGSPETRGMEINGILPAIDFGESRAYYVVLWAMEAGTIFNWDGLSLTRSPTSWELSPYMGQRDLFRAAAREMTRSGGVRQAQYSARFYDVTSLSESASFNEVLKGSWCRIFDMHDESTDTYKLDVSTRAIVVRDEYDLIHGNFEKVAEFNSERPSLADRLVLTKRRVRIPRAPFAAGSASGAGRYTTIVFRRSAALPGAPTGSTIPPTDWSVLPPVEDGNPLWMSTGRFTGDTNQLIGLWSTPVQIDAPIAYYIKPLGGTSMHNSAGTLTIEARIVAGGQDALLTSGAVRLYVGSTEVTVANGYATGSDGFTGVFDSGDIAGSVLVTLKELGEDPLDTITLVDISDGGDAIYGYVEASSGLAWTQAVNEGAWAPTSATTDLDFTFVQGGAAVCRDAKRVTRDSSGLLTVTDTAHKDDDLDEATFVVSGSGTQALTITAAFGGVIIAETVITSRGGSDGSDGTDSRAVKLTAATYAIAYDSDGDNPDPSPTIVLTATAQNFTNPWFKFTGDGISDEGTFTDGTGDSDTFNFPVPAAFFAAPKVLRVGVSDGDQNELAFDTIVIVAVKEGTSGYTVVVTNEAHTLPTTNADVVTYTGSGTQIIAFRGAVELNGVTAGTPGEGEFRVMSVDDQSITVGAISSPANPIVVADHSAMTADTAAITFTINLENIVTSVTKIQTLAKSNQGADGENAVQYYIKPLTGTAIHNGTGTITVEAHQLTGDADVLLSSGTIKLFVGSTEVTVANGYATGSDGYTGVFDSGDISGDVVVLLKDGAGGTVLDTITLVDIADGAAGDAGAAAVYGFIEPSNGLGWRQDKNLGSWVPAGTITDLDVTFVQGGTTVARDAYRLTLTQAAGTIAGSATAHPLGDLNTSRITITPSGSGTGIVSVLFSYSFDGFAASVTETVYAVRGGDGGDYWETRFKRSATQPDTPGPTDTDPSGWTTAVPAADGNPLWASAARYNAAGTSIVTAWSTPEKISGDDLPTFEDVAIRYGDLSTAGQKVYAETISIRSADTVQFKVENGVTESEPSTGLAEVEIAGTTTMLDLSAAPDSGTTQTLAAGVKLGETRTVWIRARDDAGGINGKWVRFLLRNDVVLQNIGLEWKPPTTVAGDKTNARFVVSPQSKVGNWKLEYLVDEDDTDPVTGDATTVSSSASTGAAIVVADIQTSTRDTEADTTTFKYLHYRVVAEDYVGKWGSGIAYSAANVVENDSGIYRCFSGHTSGASTEPGTGASWTARWVLEEEGSPYIISKWAIATVPLGVVFDVTLSYELESLGSSNWIDHITVALDHALDGWQVSCLRESGGTRTMLVSQLAFSQAVFNESTEEWDFEFETKFYNDPAPIAHATYRVKVYNASFALLYSDTITGNDA